MQSGGLLTALRPLISAPNYSFQTLDGASVLRLQNVLSNAQRVGWSTATTFPSDVPIQVETRFNTMVQSPSTGIDQLLELWLLDPTNQGRYDEVELSAPAYGSDRIFAASSSISGHSIDTNFQFSDNTWYRMVLTGSPTGDVWAYIYADDGTTELTGFDLGNTLSAFGNDGFEIGLSQSMGLPNGAYPTDVAVDYLEVTTTPEPSTLCSVSVLPVLLAMGYAGDCNTGRQHRWRSPLAKTARRFCLSPLRRISGRKRNDAQRRQPNSTTYTRTILPNLRMALFIVRGLPSSGCGLRFAQIGAYLPPKRHVDPSRG